MKQTFYPPPPPPPIPPLPSSLRRWNRNREVADAALAYAPAHARAFARQFLSGGSSSRRMAVVCAYAQSRAPAHCREGVVFVEWEGGRALPLEEAVVGLEHWGNAYRPQ